MSSTLDLLLMGKTGNGKSATGNSILKEAFFDESVSAESVTKSVNYKVTRHNGRMIKVVDGPGTGDTNLDAKDRLNQIVNFMEMALKANAKGYHAFLLVVKMGRFTDEDQETIKLLKGLFGDNILRDHCIVVTTFGDSFQKQAKRTKETFQEWCLKQTGAFRELIKECHYRVVLFNNMTEDVERKDAQICELLKAVDSLEGRRYTVHLFDNASPSRNWEMAKLDRHHLEKELEAKVAEITAQVNKMTFNLSINDRNASKLKEFLTACNSLDCEFKKCDRGSGALRELEERLLDTTRYIERNMETLKKTSESERREKELQANLQRAQEKRTELENQIKPEDRALNAAVVGSSIVGGVGFALAGTLTGGVGFLVPAIVFGTAKAFKDSSK